VRVACLVPYPLDFAPSQRFRVEQWGAPLRARGIDVDFVPFLEPETMGFLYKPGRVVEKSRDVLAGVMKRAAWSMRHARDYDVVVIHREAWLLGVDWIERYLAPRVPTVFDFDDAVWLPNISKANKLAGRLKGFAKIDRILGMVTSVSAGCEYLATRARMFNGDVHIVPTSIDLGTYSPPRMHEDVDVLTVGWTGSVTTGPYLQQIAGALAAASKRVKMRVSVLGAKVELPGVDVECQEWTAEKEVRVIRSFDVGLKPVPREDWVRGKCPMKDIQYMALGVPCVATRFGTSVESITHGTNGFLCDGDSDWGDALVALSDTKVRRRMGVEGLKVVEERYASTVAADAFAGALASAKKRFRPRGAWGRRSILA
jgi:glycosyltransferase involved in cell wall biosynthesis